MNAELYIKQGDKIYKSGGWSTAGFIKANSREELPAPNTVAEGTVALVPSSGGGGLPVVDLETNIFGADTEGMLSEADAAKMDAVLSSDVFVAKAVLPTDNPVPIPVVFTKTVTEDETMFTGSFGFTTVLIGKVDEGWVYLRATLSV